MLGREVHRHSEVSELGMQIVSIKINQSESNIFTFQVLLDGKHAKAGKLIRRE